MPLLLRFFMLGLIFASPLVTSVEAQLSLEDTLPGIPEVVVQGRDFTVDEQAGLATFRVDVRVPADHHGYLDRGDEGFFIPLAFVFDSLEEHGFRVTEISRPSGTRDDIVHATVLRDSGAFEFRLETPDDTFPSGTFSATLRHQICNDVTNICYPPKITIFPIRFAKGTVDENTPALANITQQSAPALTLSERLTALFRRHFANFPMALLLVFLAGLIASATPCVYPVIPITSAILMARGGGARRLGQLNALVYFLGITFFFTLLGTFAATTGTALSALMTSAWVNLAFAGIFAYFGLSMIGFYEFQFLTPLIAKLDNTAGRWDGFFGTFLMGATAGLVISPCVGPIAGAILLDITGQAADTQLSGSTSPGETALRGIGLMASFGMGLGVPFLVVGMLSNGLPQSGPWLTKVKFLLSIPILYFAYVLLSQGHGNRGRAAEHSSCHPRRDTGNRARRFSRLVSFLGRRPRTRPVSPSHSGNHPAYSGGAFSLQWLRSIGDSDPGIGNGPTNGRGGAYATRGRGNREFHCLASGIFRESSLVAGLFASPRASQGRRQGSFCRLLCDLVRELQSLSAIGRKQRPIEQCLAASRACKNLRQR